jgi:hypothetical protein
MSLLNPHIRLLPDDGEGTSFAFDQIVYRGPSLTNVHYQNLNIRQVRQIAVTTL